MTEEVCHGGSSEYAKVEQSWRLNSDETRDWGGPEDSGTSRLEDYVSWWKNEMEGWQERLSGCKLTGDCCGPQTKGQYRRSSSCLETTCRRRSLSWRRWKSLRWDFKAHKSVSVLLITCSVQGMFAWSSISFYSDYFFLPRCLLQLQQWRSHLKGYVSCVRYLLHNVFSC